MPPLERDVKDIRDKNAANFPSTTSSPQASTSATRTPPASGFPDESTEDPQKRRGYAPSAPQPGCGRITSMSFAEAAARMEAVRAYMQHAIDGDIDPLDGIHYARRLLAEAERLLKRDAA